MKYGDCILFDTKRTPHTAFQYINGSEKHRKSIELRILILDDHTQSSKCSTFITW